MKKLSPKKNVSKSQKVKQVKSASKKRSQATSKAKMPVIDNKENAHANLHISLAEKYPAPPEDTNFAPAKKNHHITLIVTLVLIVAVISIIASSVFNGSTIEQTSISATGAQTILVEKTIEEKVPIIPDLGSFMENLALYDRQSIQAMGYASYVTDKDGTITVSNVVLADDFGNEIKLEKVPKLLLDKIQKGKVLVNVSGVFYQYNSYDAKNRPRLVISTIEEIEIPYTIATKIIYVNQTVMN
jgi:hypothetical protein